MKPSNAKRRNRRDWITPTELGRQFGVTHRTVHQWIEKKFILATATTIDARNGKPSRFVITRDEARFLKSKIKPGQHTHIDFAKRPYLKGKKGAAA